jgi:hypothetical protein
MSGYRVSSRQGDADGCVILKSVGGATSDCSIWQIWDPLSSHIQTMTMLALTELRRPIYKPGAKPMPATNGPLAKLHEYQQNPSQWKR